MTIGWAKRRVAEAAAARAETSTDKDLLLLAAKLRAGLRMLDSMSSRATRRLGLTSFTAEVAVNLSTWVAFRNLARFWLLAASLTR